MNPVTRFIHRFRAALSTPPETDNTFYLGQSQTWLQRDRYTWDRLTILNQVLEAYQQNPLARRIVGLTSQYVVGGGISINCKSEPVTQFIHDFWSHRLNHMDVRCYEWCDELTRAGNLFVLISTDRAGMSYVRAVPASQIDAIAHATNDIEQATAFRLKPFSAEMTVGAGSVRAGSEPAPTHPNIMQEITYPAYNEQTDAPDEDGSFPPVMMQYTVNRPVGA